ncbi:alpha/beta fold hydrolase [Streptomyces sp. AV19]|uniref:alpha/beta hydrolase family protein n=1 Tax=Streptomyces sp. AV19 TaxID=2793068 RepID=UPI0018FE72F7|nr:alpha/beta fold hydrolase [Streptomyces sp. AV19]MBH1938816.1 alpha/beta fold hydrolase [Streptomyces sp. AV19]MDG4534749.1 alpha/beta fold hydrolase [Streptomyces sp. AV19]
MTDGATAAAHETGDGPNSGRRTAVSDAGLEEERRVLALAPVAPPARGRYGDHPEQVYDLWPGDGPLVILLHGGFWRYDRTHLTPLAAHLAGHGFAVALPGFRLSGGTGGYPETFDDVALALDTIPGGRPYVLAGHSSGGHLALWAGARGLLPPESPWFTAEPPPAVLALAPVADLTATVRDGLSDDAALQLLGGPGHIEDRLPLTDPITLVRTAGTTGVPTVLLHGEADEEVPPAQSTAYATAHADAELLLLPGTGHYTPIEPGAEACRTMIDALKRLSRD